MEIVELLRHTLLVAFYLALPPMTAAALAGFAVGLVQSATGQHDQAVSFVPRLLAAGGAVLIFGVWMMSLATDFCYKLWASLPELIR
jgi:flagellar biosynthetic protein FliQ